MKYTMVIGVCLIVMLFAQYWVHYLLAACGILFILADVWKQGLSKEGLLIVARGKELYKWEKKYNSKR